MSRLAVLVRRVSCLATLLAFGVGCRRVPSNIRPTFERHLPEIRSLASASAARCPAIRETGLAALVNGTVPASPAIGTSLETDPEVLQVKVSCYWPMPGSAGGTGNAFRPLHAEGARRNGSLDAYKVSGTETAHTLVEVATPSTEVNDPAAFDVHVMQPAAAGSWVDMIVTLEPGHTNVAPYAPPQLPIRAR